MSSYDDTQRRENLAIINQMVKYISAKICGGNAMVELDIDIDSELKERMDAHLHELLNRQRDKITFERVLAVLALIQEQLMTGSGTMTKRQIYYSNVMLFDSKMEAADRAIDKTCEILAKVSNKMGSFARSSVAIFASSKGMVYGAVTWTMPTGARFDAMLGTGLSIEPNMNGIKFSIKPEVESIIVVEKEAVFQQLATEQSGQMDYTRTIIVTGKGYPDVSTRLFLRKLLDQYSRLHLFGLVGTVRVTVAS